MSESMHGTPKPESNIEHEPKTRHTRSDGRFFSRHKRKIIAGFAVALAAGGALYGLDRIRSIEVNGANDLKNSDNSYETGWLGKFMIDTRSGPGCEKGVYIFAPGTQVRQTPHFRNGSFLGANLGNLVLTVGQGSKLMVSEPLVASGILDQNNNGEWLGFKNVTNDSESSSLTIVQKPNYSMTAQKLGHQTLWINMGQAEAAAAAHHTQVQSNSIAPNVSAPITSSTCTYSNGEFVDSSGIPAAIATLMPDDSVNKVQRMFHIGVKVEH